MRRVRWRRQTPRKWGAQNYGPLKITRAAGLPVMNRLEKKIWALPRPIAASAIERVADVAFFILLWKKCQALEDKCQVLGPRCQALRQQALAKALSLTQGPL